MRYFRSIEFWVWSEFENDRNDSIFIIQVQLNHRYLGHDIRFTVTKRNSMQHSVFANLCRCEMRVREVRRFFELFSSVFIHLETFHFRYTDDLCDGIEWEKLPFDARTLKFVCVVWSISEEAIFIMRLCIGQEQNYKLNVNTLNVCFPFLAFIIFFDNFCLWETELVLFVVIFLADKRETSFTYFISKGIWEIKMRNFPENCDSVERPFSNLFDKIIMKKTLVNFPVLVFCFVFISNE